ncbi:unnamed protein product, partial [Symbiodinium pilosum]
GTLLGASLGCLAGFVRFFLGKPDGKASSSSATLSAPLRRGAALGSAEGEGFRGRRPSRFVSERLLGEVLGPSPTCPERRWIVRQALHEKAFLNLLSRFLAEARLGRLQTTPKHGPAKEHFAATLIQDELACFAGRHGPLKIEPLEFETGRPNLKVTYPGLEHGDTITFVSHIDVPDWAQPQISLPGGCCQPVPSGSSGQRATSRPWRGRLGAHHATCPHPRRAWALPATPPAECGLSVPCRPASWRGSRRGRGGCEGRVAGRPPARVVVCEASSVSQFN